jgi:hypothetical protein
MRNRDTESKRLNTNLLIEETVEHIRRLERNQKQTERDLAASRKTLQDAIDLLRSLDDPIRP